MLVQNKYVIMTDPSVYKEIEKLIRNINEEVTDEDVEEPDAEDIIKSLSKDGGSITVIGDDFEVQREHVSDVKERIDEGSYHSYGLDGSTTKDLKFNNGLTLSIAVAAASITGTDDVGRISQLGTISVASYFENETIDIVPESTDDTQVYFTQFPRLTDVTNDLSQWLNSIARTKAEGKHFEWVSENIDGPLFVDGPVIPPDIMIWVSYDQHGYPDGTPMEDGEDIVLDILQSYINGIENCVTNNVPVYGVQKSTTATRVLEALDEKDPELEKRDMPWTDDATLFNSALQPNETSQMNYTPWYIEEKIDVGNRFDLITPLKSYDKIDLSLGTYEDYIRAFFFAKPPNQTTVYRIGVPKIVFQYMDKDKVRDIALREMAKQFREPLPVVVADEKVRIPRDLRDKFRRLINSEAYKGTNEQRGYE